MARRRIRVVAVIGLALLSVSVGAVVGRRSDDGLILRTVAVPGQPVGVAVDAQMGHTFILSATTIPPTESGYVTMLDTASGRLLHTVAVGWDPTDIAIDERTKRVFVTDLEANMVSVLDAHTAAVLHTTPVGTLPPHAAQRVALDTRSNHLFVAGVTGVSMLDARTGAVLRTVTLDPTDSGIVGIAVDKQTGRVFVADYSHNSVSMLDARSGTVLRTVIVGAAPFQLLAATQAGRIFVLGKTSVSVLDARTGAIIRTSSVGLDTTAVGVEEAALAIDDKTARVCVTNPRRGTVSVLNMHTGAVMHVVAVGPAYFPVVDVRHQRVLVATAGHVRILDALTGRVLHTAGDQSPVALVVSEQAGRVYVINQGTSDATGTAMSPGSVSVLDARRGTILQTTAVGWNPIGGVVDERRGRVIIVNYGGRVHVSDTWRWVPSWLRQRLPFLPRQPRSIRIVPGSVSVLDARRQ